MRRLLIVSLFCAVACASCDSPKPAPQAIVPMTPEQELAQAGAKHWVARAKERAFNSAIMRARSQFMRQDQKLERPAKLEQSARLTLLFSANNHGEREDCGCKRNPLGGLTRRATLIDMLDKTATDETAARYWTEVIERPGTTFIADAGDLLFKSATVKSSPQATQDEALVHAEAVVFALNERAPDVVNVGEYDLALGVESLEALAKKASFPMVSANLKKVGADELLFPGHVVVERAGKKVAYIGVLKERARVNRYYEKQGVEVSSPKAAYVSEVAKLPGDVDLVVLLSNEGVPGTRALVKGLREDGARLDVAVVSNSNMLTRQPKWTEGVPVVEPMSRGKQFGRMEFWLTGDDAPVFMNDVPGKLARLEPYRKAQNAYMQAQYKVAQLGERQAKLRVQIERAEPGKTPQEVAQSRAQAEQALTQLEPMLKAAQQKLELTSMEAVAQAGTLDVPQPTSSRGDDWLELSIVPVLLEIPEEPKTRKVLDRYKK